VNPQPAALSDAVFAFCFVLILLVPLAGAGLALINTGLGRSRSAAHTMLASLCVMAVVAVVYAACGFAWQGYAGRVLYVVHIGGRKWSWIAARSGPTLEKRMAPAEFRPSQPSQPSQGIATLLGFVLRLTCGLNLLLDRFYHQGVGPDGERQGMDLYELGAGAYPEFLTHSDDFLR
jgi:ammonia channel protein AmtB